MEIAHSRPSREHWKLALDNLQPGAAGLHPGVADLHPESKNGRPAWLGAT